MKETHVILHRRFLKNMHGTFFPYFVSGCAYLRVTARREKQNHIVSEPDIEPGLSPATDSQVLEVAQAVAKRESEAGQRAISCAKQWNDMEWLARVFLFVSLCLCFTALSSTGGPRVVAVFFHTGLLRFILLGITRVWDRCAKTSFLQCFHFHNCLERRYVSVSLATPAGLLQLPSERATNSWCQGTVFATCCFDAWPKFF